MAEAVQSEGLRATDEELLKKVRDGDRDAFESLYERYLKRIYSFVHKRLRNRADTEETVQEVFINVFSSVDSYRGEAPFSAWVLGVARRTVASRFKRKQHPTVPLDPSEEPTTLDLMVPMLSRSATPLEAYEYSERMERLVRAADEELTAEQRRLFELHHIEHRSIADIATRLQKSEDSVKSNLYRTRKLLLAR
jgi:RNA polymerase sigma-70 factor (ECF subfamily)